MKKRFFTSIILIFFFFSFQPEEVFSKNDDAKKLIRSAADRLLEKPAKSTEDVQRGLDGLLEAIKISMADTTLPEEFKAKIKSGSELMSKNLFDTKGISLLNEAYMLINKGKRFQMPEKIISISDAIEYGKKQIESALEALEQGNNEKAVKPVLETILMVVTPMPKI